MKSEQCTSISQQATLDFFLAFKFLTDLFLLLEIDCAEDPWCLRMASVVVLLQVYVG